MRKLLLRRGWPRLVATCALGVAGAVAFLASVILLGVGLSSMGLRYPLAALVGYLGFLGSLRLAVGSFRQRMEVDLFDLADLSSRGNSSSSSGGGSSSAESTPDIGALDLPVPDLDEGAVLFVPLFLVLAGVLAVAYTVMLAPVLVAELVLEVVVLASLARRFARLEPRGWFPSALRRTWLPFMAVLLSLALAGACADVAAPEADSLGDIFRTR